MKLEIIINLGGQNLMKATGDVPLNIETTDKTKPGGPLTIGLNFDEEEMSERLRAEVVSVLQGMIDSLQDGHETGFQKAIRDARRIYDDVEERHRREK